MQLQSLSENVFAVTNLFHPSGKGVNVGFLTTDKTVIHIDAGMKVTDGNALLQLSLEKTPDLEKLLLILTHHHWDHIFGMRPFKEKGTRILSHKKVYEFLSFRTPPFFRSVLRTYVSYTQKTLSKTYSYTKEQAIETLKDVVLYYPDQFFNQDIDLQIDGEKLTLLCTPGHVPDEISVYHPKSKTLFSGDTVYSGMILTTRYGGQKEWKLWIRSLEKLNGLEIEKIVPGHGAICGKEEIKRNIDYLQGLLERKNH